jgi:hypothetical protein
MRWTAGGVVVAGLAWAASAGALSPGNAVSAAACRAPVGESSLARHDGVVVWEDPGVAQASSGSVYACSPGNRRSVKLLTFQYICGSPTGCGAQGGYTNVRFAGPWVAVAAGDPTPFGAVALWNTRGTRGSRVIASWLRPDDFPGGPYALALRADGALAYADQTVNSSGATVDVLHVCDSGCLRVRRLTQFVEPGSYTGSKALLADIRFGAKDQLQWLEAGRVHTARIPQPGSPPSVLARKTRAGGYR